MGYEISYEGRIDLDPSLDADQWRRLFDHHPDFGAISEGIRKILEPIVLPVLSDDGRQVVAIEPGEYGTQHGAMTISLRRLAHVAALANEEGCRCRFSGQFNGTGEDGERYEAQISNADIIVNDQVGDTTDRV